MIKGAFIGAAMAGAMLWAMHERIMSAQFDLSGSAILFVSLHIAGAAAVLSLTLFFPAFRNRVLSHRPSAGHALAMLFGAVTLTGSVHLWMHGGFV